MKLTTFLVFLSAITIAANSYSQSTRFNLNVENVTIIQVFDEIERLTEYGFLFKTDQLDVGKLYTLRLENANIEKVMDQLLDKEKYSYKFIDRTIVISKNDSENVQPEKKTITGKVTNSFGEVIPGVTVIIKGTTQGTITGAEGNYSLPNVAEDAILVFSFVGMKTQEIPLPGKSQVDVVMDEETLGIEEVVAIGYGTVKKKDLTGGISTVAGDDIANRKVTQVSRALQGATSGVMVTRGNGDPGTSATIRIRGVTTIGDSSPLIIVDGVPVDNIDQVNSNDIESVSVLKDAASASIYGARAAAGVILLTTKRTKAGELSLNYDFNYGIEAPTGRPEVVDVTRYMQMNNELIWNDQGNTGDEYPVYTKNEVDNYYELNKQNPDQYPLTDWDNLM